MKANHLKIVLASASPRRLQILQDHGLKTVVMPSHVEEIQLPGEDAKSYVCRLAREKAQAILPHISPGSADLILAADTTVAFQDHILEKPKDHEDAYRMLSLLSGNAHEVYTGYALINLTDKHCQVDCTTSSIIFHPLSAQQINDYIATGDPFDKAGGYGIQNVYQAFVQEISGSYYNVMGLPIEDILRHLNNM